MNEKALQEEQDQYVLIQSTKMIIRSQNKKKKEKVFYIQSLLGRGGFSKTFQVAQITDIYNKNGRVQSFKLKKQELKKLNHYAIKVISRKEMKQRSQYKLRINEQLWTHQRLKHENIVQLKDYFKDKFYYYMLLELCQPYDLQRILNQRKFLQTHQVIYFFNQIVQAISYAHSQKVIHRDIKPANIFLKKDPKTNRLIVKLGDFGLARKIDHEDYQCKSRCGTPNYVSPELLNNDEQGFLVDVWSLGVLLYHLRFGFTPFSVNASITSSFDSIKKGKYDQLNSKFKKIRQQRNSIFASFLQKNNIDLVKQDDLIKQLIQKCLIVNVKERITIKEILAHEISSLYSMYQFQSTKIANINEYIFQFPVSIIDKKEKQIRSKYILSQLDLSVHDINSQKQHKQIYVQNLYKKQQGIVSYLLTNGSIGAKYNQFHIIQVNLSYQQKAKQNNNYTDKSIILKIKKIIKNQKLFVHFVDLGNNQIKILNIFDAYQKIQYKFYELVKKQIDQKYTKVFLYFFDAYKYYQQQQWNTWINFCQKIRRTRIEFTTFQKSNEIKQTLKIDKIISSSSIIYIKQFWQKQYLNNIQIKLNYLKLSSNEYQIEIPALCKGVISQKYKKFIISFNQLIKLTKENKENIQIQIKRSLNEFLKWSQS